MPPGRATALAPAWRSADAGFAMFRFFAHAFEDLGGLLGISDFEDASGSAAGSAARAVGIVDIDVMLAQRGGDIRQRAGAIG